MVAYHKHANYSFIRHTAVPVLGLIANFGCMCAYIYLPFTGVGTVKEPMLALAIAAVWAVYGGYYFLKAGKAAGKTPLMQTRVPAA
jgi:hypothetical protein